MACQRCGGDVVASRQTVPYVAPGPRVVELRNVRAIRCKTCGHLDLQVPRLTGPRHFGPIIPASPPIPYGRAVRMASTAAHAALRSEVSISKDGTLWARLTATFNPSL
jgi:YgiT-type zinc finger domain-containing protein